MDFSIIEASLTEKFGSDHFDWSGDELKPLKLERETTLNFKVKLNEAMRVSLSTGKRLQELEGYVYIRPQLEGLHEDAMGIGSLVYQPASSNEVYSSPAMYLIQVMVPPIQYAGLVDAAQNGRIPKSIFVTVRGMGSDGYDRGSKWDITSVPWLYVKYIIMDIPLAHGEAILDEGTLREPTQLQVSKLREEFGLFVKTINAKLKWLLGMILLLVLIVTVFKH